MKIRAIGSTLAFCFLAATPCFAADSQMGTWKLNEAKSKFTPGSTKNTMVVYQAAGDKVKVIVDGVDSKGKHTHNEWTGKFDGKDYPVTGDPSSDLRSYKRINDRTLELTVRRRGYNVGHGRVVVSDDGKTRTVTMRGTDLQSKDFNNKAVYDKQ